MASMILKCPHKCSTTIDCHLVCFGDRCGMACRSFLLLDGFECMGFVVYACFLGVYVSLLSGVL